MDPAGGLGHHALFSKAEAAALRSARAHGAATRGVRARDAGEAVGGESTPVHRWHVSKQMQDL